MSRLRENPERLFEVFLEVGKPTTEKSEPFILQKYPLDFNDEEILKSVPKFAFPCDTERYTTTVDHFTVTFTDLDGKFKFGFCRHATGAQTCFCIVSFLPWFEVFYNLLNSLAEITNRTEDNDLTELLRAAYVTELLGPSLPVTVVANQEMFSFKAPDPNKLPAIPTSRNLTEYYNAIDTENMMIIFASMLNERRIVITSKRLSRLAAVVHAATALLYPMYWQHLFIPVLPAFLIDYLTAPMPFVIGVHSKLLENVRTSELGDAVIVDADTSTVTTEYDDLEDLPVEVSSYLKRHLKADKVKNSMQGSGDVISKTFMMSLVKLIGGYRDALKFTEGDPITFNPEAFVQSRPLSMQPFLSNMLQLQIFQQFINERLDILNCGKGFTDIFEQECLLQVDKLNAQTRYNEWLRKMKHQGKKFQKSGKDVWGDIKDKAGPVMKEARGAMDQFTHRVKSSGKKAYSKARTKITDRKKPPRPAMSPSSDNISSMVVPHINVVPSSRDRLSRLAAHDRPDNRVSTDDSDLVYTRVSVNLLSDPDMQNVMFKSASAENLPKASQSIQKNGSSGTLSINSSDDAETTGGHFADDRDSAQQNILYTTLLEDDDSGIVVRAGSQSSLDTSNRDLSANVPCDRERVILRTVGHNEQSVAPPIPAPRKSASPSLTIAGDKLITSDSRRPRPQPLPRRASLDKKVIEDTNRSLINLGSPTDNLDMNISGQFHQLTGSGDYVVLREPKTNQSNITPNRRSSVSRTPAMKLQQSETPKRPTVRREQSPDDPMLDFDPLFNKNNSSSSLQNNKQINDCDSSDSLLKDWNLSGLQAGSQSSPMAMTHTVGQSVGGQYPCPAPRHSILLNNYNPSGSYGLPNKPNVQIPLTYQNAIHSAVTPPPVPPKVPLPKPSYTSSSRLSQTTLHPGNQGNSQSDPFADLVSLNTSSTSSSSPAKPNWETFE